MRKACIAIGVDEVRDTAKLPKLRAASSGARQFSNWAKKSDPVFETFCLTDEVGPISIQDVKKDVKKIVESGSYSQLIIYFAGHGILKSSDTEIWLLSEAATDPDEAINLVGSIRYARDSGIPHVLFVSDACRSATDDGRLRKVNGSMIFPIRNMVRQRRPEIDTFYASLPGDPAYEVPADKATGDYDGVFTKCLLDGLAGCEKSLRETIEEDHKAVQVVSSRTLKPWLEAKLQESIASVSLELNQFPEVRVESQPPKYLTRLPQEPLHVGIKTSPPPPTAPFSSMTALRTLAENNGLGSYFLRKGELEPKLIAGQRSETKFNRDMDQLLSARGRESFETRTGFTVIGIEVAAAYVDGRRKGSDLFTEGGAHQIRVHDKRSSQSVVIEFVDGCGTCLAVLPGYIGTVVVEESRVVNVSYTPSRNSKHWSEYKSAREELDRRRAFAAVAARRGIFKIEREMASSFADYIRQLKAIDPTLGIYAAYAYDQSGMSDSVTDVFRWMSREPGVPIPFDVTLLAGRLGHRKSSKGFRYAPATPMLTQGWALLHKSLAVPRWLIDARKFTLPSLWTTFSSEGLQFVARMLARRRL